MYHRDKSPTPSINATRTDVARSNSSPVQCGLRKGCKVTGRSNGGLHPAGTELRRIKLSGENVCVCPGCRHHYTSKQSTVITPSRQPSTSSSLPMGRISQHDARIHKDIKAAQRHEKITVKGIGSLGTSSGSQGPKIATTNGYTQNHLSYDKDLAYNRKRALAAVHHSITGSVTVRLVRLAGSKHVVFGSCVKSTRDIPVGIGAPELLKEAHNLILPEYYNTLVAEGIPADIRFPMSTNDVLLADKHGVPYDQEQPRDVIRAHFFKKDSNGNLTQTLKSGSGDSAPAIILLVLTSQWWSSWSNWSADRKRELAEEEDYEDDVDVGTKRKSRKKKSRVASKRAATLSICAELTVANAPSPLTAGPDARVSSSSSSSFVPSPARRRREPAFSVADEGSAATSDIAVALQRQKEYQLRDVESLFNLRTFRVAFRQIKYSSLAVLIANALEGGPRTTIDCLADAVTSELTVDFGHSHSGSFKRGWFGTLKPADVSTEGFFATDTICAKQALRLDRVTNRRSLAPTAEQGPLLCTELNSIRWANALMWTVGQFVRRVTAEKCVVEPEWTPRAVVPTCSFVECGLAVEQGAKETGNIYLVEERIGGSFKKFMNNDSAIPFGSDTFSQFLAFSQHVQYIESKGLAYVNDYQGGPAEDGSCRILLTDPQILTNPELGRDLFAGGNVSPAFRRFPTEHVCTVFCEDFDLPPLTKYSTSKI